MTDQPTSGKDDTPHGEQPPSYTPPRGTESTARAASQGSEPGYGQPAFDAKGQADEQNGQPAPDYGQPRDAYGTPYGAAPQQPFGQQSYGQQPFDPPTYGQQYAAPGQPGASYNAYGQPGYYGVPAEPKTLSIASLCCGIAALVGFGFFLLPQIAAVILGHMALTREPAGRGMAIAGLVLGYVGIAITILVIVIFGIVISSARYSGYGV
ncbi:hypothetical protein QFZ79_000964 [Arthrobacter sp. V4I6]|uniref:DUF4190 domain-containing protein n=1 Tax=unclassified Arthrobacter TaxID=235627 RepID=UPI002780F88F|nr:MULTISPECIES: DUF4190 domain-containing protein [unclassified Arthrobacter]MDQ0823222.1 hypothetical protein [Arthrobacter sp. V1I7]MDQ0852853.1 hypothetical protein [Arthrobacter sp. V4I6]